MRHRHALLAAALALLLPPIAAWARPAPAPAPAPARPTETRTAAIRAGDVTALTLTETATVMVPPDELAAELRAEAAAPTAAEAQRQVNAAMADALGWADHVPGVTAAAGGYGVFRDASAKPESWQASQALTLRAADGAVLLALVGQLQEKGLALGDLHWQLSDATAVRAAAAAMQKAIGGLQARVDQAAGLLGLKFVRFTSVRLDAPSPLRPAMRMMAVPSAAAAAPLPPNATAEDIPISATVGADAALIPK